MVPILHFWLRLQNSVLLLSKHQEYSQPLLLRLTEKGLLCALALHLKYVVFKGHSVPVWVANYWSGYYGNSFTADWIKINTQECNWYYLALLFFLGVRSSHEGYKWSVGEYYREECKPVVPSALKHHYLDSGPYLLLHLSFCSLFRIPWLFGIILLLPTAFFFFLH